MQTTVHTDTLGTVVYPVQCIGLSSIPFWVWMNWVSHYENSSTVSLNFLKIKPYSKEICTFRMAATYHLYCSNAQHRFLDSTCYQIAENQFMS